MVRTLKSYDQSFIEMLVFRVSPVFRHTHIVILEYILKLRFQTVFGGRDVLKKYIVMGNNFDVQVIKNISVLDYISKILLSAHPSALPLYLHISP